MTITAVDSGTYVGVVGSTTFDGFSIPAPSAPGISVEDNGSLEVELVRQELMDDVHVSPTSSSPRAS